MNAPIIERETALSFANREPRLNLNRQAYRNLSAWIDGGLRKLTQEYREFVTPESRRKARR